jgi:hypothetical protein
MARIFTFIVSLIAFFFAVALPTVLAEAPASCAAPCKAVDRIQVCAHIPLCNVGHSLMITILSVESTRSAEAMI